MWFNTYFGELPLPSNMTAKKLARFQNDQEFITTFATLLNLVISIFKWEGLPDTINTMALESALLFRGCACFIPYAGGVTNAGAGPGGYMNLHGEYTSFWAYGWNGFNKQYDNYIPGSDAITELERGAGGMMPPANQTGVLIRDNYYMMPYIAPLVSYSKRLTDTMRRLDTTSYNLVWPVWVQVDDGQVNTAKTMIQQHDDNIPVVLGRHALDQMGMTGLNLGVNPVTLDTMWDHYNRLLGRLMEMFGIDSDPTTGKAERVTGMEVSSNSVRTELARDNRLHMREKALESAKALWPDTFANASVSYDETIIQRAAQAAGQLQDTINRTPGTGAEDD